MRAAHLCLLALIQTACDGSAGPPAPQARSVDFAHLIAAEQPIAADEVHRYPLDLAADTYLHLVVEQLGADVGLTVVDPAGEALPIIDSPTGGRGAEHLHLWAPEAGLRWLEFHLVDPATAGGAYRARIVVQRAATEDDRRQAKAAEHFWRGRSSEAADDFAAALPHYRQAAASWQRSGREDRLADTLYRLGIAHEELGQKARAVEALRRAEDLFEGSGNLRYRALSLDRLGHLYQQRGDLPEARWSFEEARRLFHQDGSNADIASMEINLGLVARRDGRPREARRHFLQAQEMFRDRGDRPREAMALNHLGLLHAAWGDQQRALALYRRAEELLGPSHPRQLANTLSNLGHVHAEAGRYPQALDLYRRALGLRQSSGESREVRRGEAVTWTGMGLVYRRTERLEAALDAYRRALATFEALEEPYARAAVLNNLGWLQVDADRPDEAQATLRQALTLARRLDHPRVEAGALFGLARAERDRGRPAAALDHLEAATLGLEEIRTRTRRDDLRIAQLASTQDLYDTYVDLLMELHARGSDANWDRRAFRISERARARNLAEILARPPLTEEVAPAPLLFRRQQLEARINALEEERRRLLEKKASATELAAADPAVPELERQIDDLRDQYHALRGEMRATHPAFSSLLQPQPVTVAELQELLAEDTQLLEIHLGPARGFLWLVSRDSFESFVLPGRESLEASARETHRRLRKSHLEGRRIPAEKALADLGQTLLAPVAQRLRGRRLLVVLPVALQNIPFAALPWEGKPLLARFEVVGLPSASVFAVLAQRSEQRPTTALSLALLADPVFQGNDPRLGRRAGPGTGLSLSRLSYTTVEAQAILDLLPPTAEVKVAQGFEANRDLVFNGALTPYRYLHFATHATLDTERPELSALVLSAFQPTGTVRPARLYAYEIYHLRLMAELVVLSACETGLGREVRGEGMVGLSRAFLFAGADSVLVSLWRVQDRATAMLMERFYRAILVDGQPPTAALRQAQESLWREGWAPYHWAGFVLQGRPR